MDIKFANIDSDAEVKKKAMDNILREICRKYRETGNQFFTQEEIHNLLKGYYSNYLDINIRSLFRGSPYIEIDDDYRLKLSENGRNYRDTRQDEQQ